MIHSVGVVPFGPLVTMTTQSEDEHIVTAEEPAWTEQRHRLGDDGSPEVVPDSLELHPLDIHGYEPEYSCSCRAEFRSWGAVREHFEEVVNSGGSTGRRRRSNSREIGSDQATLTDI